MDIRHFYIEKGRGKPLILLHGNGESSDYFKHQTEEFSRHYHVYAIDTRGHGKTPRGKGEFTISRFAEDLLNFMDEHNIDKANLLGFSDGGNIAMIFAICHPERVDRLILNGANMNPTGVKRRVQLPIEAGYAIAQKFAKKSESAKHNAEMLGLMVNEPHVTPKELGKIKSKTLIIAGTRDMIKEKHTRLIASSIPGAKLCIIKGNHFIADKNPVEFNAKILKFLEAQNVNTESKAIF